MAYTVAVEEVIDEHYQTRPPLTEDEGELKETINHFGTKAEHGTAIDLGGETAWLSCFRRTIRAGQVGNLVVRAPADAIISLF